MRRSWTRGLTLAGAAALTLPLIAMQSNANASSATASRTILKGSAPSWATAAAAVGPAKATTGMSVRVYLAPRGGQAALEAAVSAVSTPGNSQYRQFITPAQFRARFGPSGAAVSAVRSWLSNAGLHVTTTAFGNRYVAATGSASAMHSAFGVGIDFYRVQGHILRAPSTDASVPSAVAPDVIGVTGLSSDHAMKQFNTQPTFPPPAGFRNARPCSTYSGQLLANTEADHQTPLPKFGNKYRHYAICGFTPSQFRGAYGVTDSGLTGAGTTVAITDAYASKTMRSDANTYATTHGDAAFDGQQYSQSLPPNGYNRPNQCAASGWATEESLDVEAIHGIATGADVKYYASASCFDGDFRDTLARVIDDDVASYVSNSWGEPSQYETSGSIAAYEQLFLQAGMQGIGVFFSSGDNGDDVKSTGQKQTDYPASDPWVTAVGGTSTRIGQGNVMAGQTGWGVEKYVLSNDGQSWVPYADNPFQGGAGGGFSNLFNQPDYQVGVVPPDSPAGRGVPDIAMDADTTTGMLIGLTQTFPEGAHYGEFRVGGTSVASPLMAAMQADASELAGDRLGFANPAIYDLARGGSAGLTDVLPVNEGSSNVRPDFANGLDGSDGILYSVRTADDDSSLKTTVGWDDVTGVGAPNGGYFAAIAGG